MTYRYHTGIHVAMNINDIYDKWYIWYTDIQVSVMIYMIYRYHTDIHVAMNIKSIN